MLIKAKKNFGNYKVGETVEIPDGAIFDRKVFELVPVELDDLDNDDVEKDDAE
jgi:hypothetical protein